MICLRGRVLCWALLGTGTLMFLYQAGTHHGWWNFPRFRYSIPQRGTVRTQTTQSASQAVSSMPQAFLWDQHGWDEPSQSSGGSPGEGPARRPQQQMRGQDRSAGRQRCPSSIRRRVASTEFRNTFLESVPVLQWAPHARPEEYQRLQGHGGAYGWQDVAWPVVRDSLTLLNTSANGHMFDAHPGTADGDPSCIRCAVVGNGGILNGSWAGAAIDQHHYVFRVNGALTTGFEQDVGNRTSFYVFSTNTMVNSLHSYASAGFHQLPQTPETRYIFLPDHDRDYLLLRAALTHRPVDKGPDNGARPEQYFGDDLRAEKFKMFHPDFIHYIRNRFLRSSILDTPQWWLYRPSTGAVMLLAALHTCDEVSAYGFITPDYRAYSDHYFDRTHKDVRFYANHDLQLEMKLWQRLQKSRLITLYTRD